MARSPLAEPHLLEVGDSPTAEALVHAHMKKKRLNLMHTTGIADTTSFAYIQSTGFVAPGKHHRRCIKSSAAFHKSGVHNINGYFP